MLAGIFALGSLYQRDIEKEKRIARLEDVMMKSIPEIETMVARIDERTKNL